jgi:hypothetical protein
VQGGVTKSLLLSQLQALPPPVPSPYNTPFVLKVPEVSGTPFTLQDCVFDISEPTVKNFSVQFQGAGTIIKASNGASFNAQLLFQLGGNGAGLQSVFSLTNLSPTTYEAEVKNGSLRVSTVGQGLKVAEGANAKQGVSTLVGGQVVVANTSITANSRVQVTVQSLGTVSRPQGVGVSARVAGTSFTLMSADATDTSVVAWSIFEPG